MPARARTTGDEDVIGLAKVDAREHGGAELVRTGERVYTTSSPGDPISAPSSDRRADTERGRSHDRIPLSQRIRRVPRPP